MTVVSRDRTAAPAPRLFNICYVNGFQVQPGEESWCRTCHPDLLLRDDKGKVVIDRDWDELMLDPTTPANREALAGVVGLGSRSARPTGSTPLRSTTSTRSRVPTG